MSRLSALLLLLVFSLPCIGFAAVEPVTGAHATQLSCNDCHPGTKGEESFSNQIVDCDECHESVKNVHPISFKPTKEIPAGFRLSANGELLCLTCHKLHGGDVKSGFLTDAGNGWKRGRAAFCASCHGSQNVRTNPHSARRGDTRCVFCHTTPPTSKEDALASLRIETVKLCDFCHGAVEKDHPRNIDQSLSIPKELPREKDGKWSCITCHDPHGTIDTTHYIRVPYARFMERGKTESPHRADYFACKACHVESTESSIRAATVSLRFRGEINVLCVSCHVTERGHHPTGVELPTNMYKRASTSKTVMPMDEGERITCITCHDNQCDSGEFRMRMRDYDSKSYKTDLCWNCHDRSEYTKVSPHDTDYKKCVLCHETTPVKGLDQSLMAVPLMVCLHCHDVRPHPVNKSHLAKPTAIIKVDPSLPLSKDGKVVCVTCHNPHGGGSNFTARLRSPDPRQMCSMCHWR